MFEAKRMLYLYVESPLHAGTGRGLGGIDLPIQRERVTGYPIVHAGGLKGCLRAACQDKVAHHTAIFGPETEHAADHAGALSPHDARVLLLPVRSLAGVFAWTTSVDALQRFLRATALADASPTWQPPMSVDTGQARVAPDHSLDCGGKIVLEDFAFTPEPDQNVATIGQWLAEHALPADPLYTRYWGAELPKKLCILPDVAFQRFARLATEVATRVQLDSETKTVKRGALWTEEYLSVDTLLYAPVLASPARDGSPLSGAQILEEVAQAGLKRIQLGGNETIGRGVVHVRFSPGGAI